MASVMTATRSGRVRWPGAAGWCGPIAGGGGGFGPSRARDGESRVCAGPLKGYGPSRARDGHAVVGRTLKSGKSQGHYQILAVQTGRNTYDKLSYLSSIYTCYAVQYQLSAR